MTGSEHGVLAFDCDVPLVVRFAIANRGEDHVEGFLGGGCVNVGHGFEEFRLAMCISSLKRREALKCRKFSFPDGQDSLGEAKKCR